MTWLHDNYSNLKQLGKGASGKVYRAMRRDNKKTVAVKVIDTYGASPERLQRLLKEVKILEQTVVKGCNPYIACYYSHYLNRNKLYIEMEYVDGQDLYRYLETFSANSAESTELGRVVMVTMAQALMFLHDKGIIHRDIKPKNIIIGKDLIPKLIDFGGSCLELNSDDDICTKSYISEGLVNKEDGDIGGCCKGLVGTLKFIPPEILIYKIAYPQSDMWSWQRLYIMS